MLAASDSVILVKRPFSESETTTAPKYLYDAKKLMFWLLSKNFKQHKLSTNYAGNQYFVDKLAAKRGKTALQIHTAEWQQNESELM